MFHVENAYHLHVIPPTVHRYTYTDTETTVQHDTVSPVSKTAPLRTLLTTGYNGCLYYEFSDPATVYESLQIENNDGTIDTYTQTGSGYYVLRKNGNDTGYRSIDYPFQLCVRTDTIWKTSAGYSAGGRFFIKFYSSSQGWQIDSTTLSDCKLTPQTWTQNEKQHLITMSG